MLNKFRELYKKNIWVKLLTLFIGFNLIVFSTVCSQQSIGRPHAKAKVFISAASVVNMLYIFPISKVFGWDRTLAKPFYPIRDALYNEGLKLLPKDDGEREMAWFLVKYKEYVDLIETEILDYTIKGKKYPKEKIAKFHIKTDELYTHLKPMATLKIEDKWLREKRFGLWIDVAWTYERRIHLLLSDFEIKNGRTGRYIKKEEDINKIVDIYNLYTNLKTYTKKYEPEGLHYFYNKTTRYAFEQLLLRDISNDVLYRNINLHKFSCDDPFLKIYGDSYTKLTKLYNDTNIPFNNRRLIDSTLGFSKEEIIMVKQCPNRSELKALTNYIERARNKSINQIKVGE